MPRTRFTASPLAAWLLTAWLLTTTGPVDSRERDAPESAGSIAARKFDGVVARLLARRCLSCHNDKDLKGKLDLSRKETALAGGESGRVIVPGKPEESLLWEYVSGDEMPPRKPLPDREKEVVREWIASGANWGTSPIDVFRFTTERRAGYDWWSLQPLERPALPEVKDSRWPRQPIDVFVLARLEKEKLRPSPPAGRRVLIRRLHLDLLGLPPPPEDVAAFAADDSSGAYERLVDRLLASPHHGERWARHWLDVVRFGESQGFERDRLRPNSWRYRDWVVDALNRDLPYDQFVRMQLAGDLLEPGDPSAIAATGFLVAGAYDMVGQEQQSAAMKAVVRQDELEDIVGTVGQAFLGLTVNCARCHDHKFDPVKQVEYYRLTAALGGVRHGERAIASERVRQEGALRAKALQARIDALETRRAALDGRVRQEILAARKAAGKSRPAPPRPIARWNFDGDLRDSIGGLHGEAHDGQLPEGGALLVDGKKTYVSSRPIARDLKARTLEAWVLLKDLGQRGGGVMSLQTLDGGTFDAIVFGEREPRRWMAGSDSFRRTRPLGGPEEKEAATSPVHVAIVYDASGTITAYRNGQPYGKPYRPSAPVTYRAGKAQIVFGLRHGQPGGNRMLAGAIDRAQLYDRALSAEEIAASAGVESSFVPEQELVRRLTPVERERREHLRLEFEHLRKQKKRAVATVIYAVVPREPGATHLLIRGNPASKGQVVAPGGVASLAGLSPDFGLPPDAPEAQRRLGLASWMTDPRNSLLARTIVNRLWHHHFGAGIVDSPNDLGFNGGRPTHPAMLDWLATELRRSDWSVKRLHRLIVTSATYRQSSRFREAPARIDRDGRLLWRKTPLRIEAECVRDAVLCLAGELNPAMGGPGYHDFDAVYRLGTEFYEPLDPVGHSFNRRSLYRTWARGGRNPLLDVFDCPDPSTTAPRRAVTTTPLQALALMNNSFILRMAEHAGGKLRREAGEDPARQVARLYELAYGRPAESGEIAVAVKFIAEHGLAALCRVIINSSEFLHVD